MCRYLERTKKNARTTSISASHCPPCPLELYTGQVWLRGEHQNKHKRKAKRGTWSKSKNALTSPGGNNSMEHYQGPVNPRNYALEGAVGDTYAQTSQNDRPSNQYVGCPSAPCRYPRSSSLGTCNTPISCASAPDHFRTQHGVENTTRTASITCRWVGCDQPIVRNNFIRHIREVHLGHGRNVGH
ncbi:hypothetical protein EDC04DRAFT_821602 [Pisolithus marmoratus]|nr:hypothetical protein EDC04DRAFT_821602 [Pisolithus marmoratus]